MLEGEQTIGQRAPKFGTPERSEFDAARRQAAAEERPVIPKKQRVLQAKQKVKEKEQRVLDLEAAEWEAFTTARAPDPPLLAVAGLVDVARAILASPSPRISHL